MRRKTDYMKGHGFLYQPQRDCFYDGAVLIPTEVVLRAGVKNLRNLIDALKYHHRLIQIDIGLDWPMTALEYAGRTKASETRTDDEVRRVLAALIGREGPVPHKPKNHTERAFDLGEE